MAEQRWTVVLVPHGSRGSRAVQVSRRALRWVGGSVSALCLTGLVFGYMAASKTIDLTRLERLERRNELLRQELDQARQLIGVLGDTMAVIAQRDRQIRLLAGLEPVDPDVQLAGIGGPSGGWTEREQILSEGPTGRRALETRSTLDELLRRARLLAGSYATVVESLSMQLDRLERTPSISPIAPATGWFFSSAFAPAGRLHPIFNEARPHEGIDISAPLNTPIIAPAAGRVIDVDTKPGYGRIVAVDHGHGVVTRYAHCSRILVRAGQWVKRGERLALVGNTGIATAPHVHYEILVNGQPVNPRNYIILPEAIVD